jgi:hypothetical protein
VISPCSLCLATGSHISRGVWGFPAARSGVLAGLRIGISGTSLSFSLPPPPLSHQARLAVSSKVGKDEKTRGSSMEAELKAGDGDSRWGIGNAKRVEKVWIGLISVGSKESWVVASGVF